MFEWVTSVEFSCQTEVTEGVQLNIEPESSGRLLLLHFNGKPVLLGIRRRVMTIQNNKRNASCAPLRCFCYELSTFGTEDQGSHDFAARPRRIGSERVV